MSLELPPFRGTQGAVYVAFGNEYCKIGAASAQSLVKHTGLPIHVVTNTSKAPKFPWPAGTTFEIIKKPDRFNRALRTQLYKHTPFDRTLLLDADILVTSAAAALPLRYLSKFDAVMVTYRQLRNVSLADQWGPIKVALGTKAHYTLCGGILYFQQNEQVHELFDNWYKYWKAEGEGRDMPSLFRAVWDTPHLKTWYLPGDKTWIGAREGIFRHSPSQRVPELPVITKYKPNALDEHGRKRRWVKVDTYGRPKEADEELPEEDLDA